MRSVASKQMSQLFLVYFQHLQYLNIYTLCTSKVQASGSAVASGAVGAKPEILAADFSSSLVVSSPSMYISHSLNSR